MKRKVWVSSIVAAAVLLSAFGSAAWASGTRGGQCCGQPAQEQCCEQVPAVVDVPDCCG